MEYDIKLTQQDLQAIFLGLGEIPLKLGINLVEKLRAEVARQDEAKAVPLADLGLTHVRNESYDNS